MAYRIQHNSTLRERALQQLYALQEFSLANYAAQSRLYVGDGERPFLVAIRDIAQQQAARAIEIGSLLANRRVFLQRQGFPLRFTGLNDLSAAYVARQILGGQPELIAAIGQCVDKLHGDHEGQMLARRILADEEENLRCLKRVLGEKTDAATNLRIAA
jgi:hypothetical protein